MSAVYFPHRQLDIMYADRNTISIPPEARFSGRDFITFNIPRNLPMNCYDVVVEALDTSGALWRKIGKLRHRMQVPQVRFAEHARIAVLPNTERMPRFVSELVRGSEYVIPDTNGTNGTFQMSFTGSI